MKFKILDKKTPFKGFFQIDVYTFQHELFLGGWSPEITREIFVRGKAVAVLLHDPNADTVLMIEQFRPGAIDDEYGPWMTEIVAGIVEADENEEEMARRECLEEAGCEIDTLEHIIDYYPSPGGSTECIGIYYAPLDLSNVRTAVHGLAAEGEDIRVSVVARETVMEWLQQGKIRNSLTIIALQWLALRQQI